jgi:hypothetical protein
MSLLGALTPLGKVAPKKWFQAALAYTLGGCLSATLVGTSLGALGHQLLKGNSVQRGFCAVFVFSLLLAAREWGWIHFTLPEWQRQTEKLWLNEFGFLTASAMWGLHIGLGFATRITFGGFWVLIFAVLLFGDPRYGALLIATYWLGRALPVWLALWLRSSESDATEVTETVLSGLSTYRQLTGVSLVWIGAVALSLVFPMRSSWHSKLIPWH